MCNDTRSSSETCCIIDPTSELFGSRVLSRDESGKTRPEIATLPGEGETEVFWMMSVIWQNSFALTLEDEPYMALFLDALGIGDINGAFLPPARQLPSSSLDTTSTDSTQASKPDASIVSTPQMTLTDPSGTSDTILTSSNTETPRSTTPMFSSSAGGITSSSAVAEFNW
ncbi:uncharacterized protein MELLADRAFT_103481 [Melampsora larici-populina 98AG31]|uniref:Uncharacterized protein n=1 Tax=Melampsora larici-populina (strain 98AG31 / pathotype 3-4-7) TaxID=747676 RepID=F4RB56_MELLP|nr:uncharacterized protein MELLADRAFT_103481 [Melampsora larici-populina 98AG31]EGG10342.1 hypothetical protein MELLADRAFT_103481 [Melampsora larici-populina 98AG31]